MKKDTILQYVAGIMRWYNQVLMLHEDVFQDKYAGQNIHPR